MDELGHLVGGLEKKLDVIEPASAVERRSIWNLAIVSTT
jgi:hypothetical protein